jgi:hypothetical protein
MNCWLAQFSDTPCEGQLVKAHLLPRSLLKREARERADELINDPRSYVIACGGPTGIGGHHGQLDHSRILRIPRHMLPAGVEELAEELRLGYWLDREYGVEQTWDAA